METAVTDVQRAESSPAPAEYQEPNLNIPSEREAWLRNDVLPTKGAESAPAQKPSATEEVEKAAPAPEAGTQQEQKRRGNADSRIQELLAERKELRDRLTALEAKAAPQPAEQKKVAEDPGEAPEFKDGETWPEFKTREREYYRALARFEAKSLLTESQKETETKTAQQEEAASIKEKFDAGRAKYSDFDAVALNPQLPLTQACFDHLRNRAAGVDVVYHLGKNLDQAAQIAAMPFADAVFELAKIELSLSHESDPEPVTTQRAPKPPAQIAGGKAAPGDPIKAAVENDDFRAYFDLENRKALDKKSAFFAKRKKAS